MGDARSTSGCHCTDRLVGEIDSFEGGASRMLIESRNYHNPLIVT